MIPLATPKPRLIALVGATGVGKTQMALDLAGRLGGEIISADSMQVYRGMDIGTAKPTPEERKRIPHHLLDVVDPDEPFDVARYCLLAREAIARLHREKKTVFVVGGTGLYIRALLGGLIDGPGEDRALRGELRKEMGRSGKEILYQRLLAKDPRAAARIHPRDAVRMIRALEVLELTGKSIVAHQEDHGFREQPYEALRIGLRMDRERLLAGIERRTERMIADGFLEEVRGLLERGYEPSLKPMQSLGYRHLADCLAGRTNLDEAVRLIQRDTCRYAKRQMTWFAAEPDVEWVSPGDPDAVEARILLFLEGR
jgi:tRNA dimethylallyltransferase